MIHYSEYEGCRYGKGRISRKGNIWLTSLKLSQVLLQDQSRKHISDNERHAEMKRSEKCLGKFEGVLEVHCRYTYKQHVHVHKTYLALLSPTLSSVAKYMIGNGKNS